MGSVIGFDAMCHSQFELLELLSYKIVVSLALCSEKHMGDMNTLAVPYSCTQFALDSSRMILRSNLDYISKVPTLSYRSLSFV